MIDQTVAELREQCSTDFLISMQSNPVVIAQLQVWEMVKHTADWPPESITHMKQIADAMHYCLGRISPMIETVEFVSDDAQEEDEEEI